MTGQTKKRIWQSGYGLCCLIYVVWMIHLSLNNFAMIHNDYRQAVRRLQPQQLKEMAFRELVDQCRRESAPKDAFSPPQDNGFNTSEKCLSWPAEILQTREQAVAIRLDAEKRGTMRKLLLCYIVFGIFFLFLPPVILYLLLSFFIWIFNSARSADKD